MCSQIETDVKAFIATFTGCTRESVQPESTLFGDLGIDGDDAVEFFESFSKKFEIDITGFNFQHHFGTEGSGALAAFNWIKMLFRTGSPEDKACIEAITIENLVLAAERKTWRNLDSSA
ncbi:acyl carrier protein [Jeongeupia naejangsanensis]|uniref:DUF1493 family protein n=1 Tax=Jeongeupia naejangsanensis TaxID=613195 RepID=A0ABS2BKL2_9NEIS|nr:DUF1493 family protein [Jeongeupia naejangsanensis]MBM3116141.1 DUF1493 family protein [Jeongeupia naejangsanensis]